MAMLKDSLITGDLRVTGTIYGIGTNLTNIDASQITSGTLPVARGGTGQTTAAGIFNVVRDNGGNSTWVNVSGDTMTGFLTLHANPTNNLHAATKQYVDNAFAANDAMIFKGIVNANGDLPANHKVGWTYRVGTAGTYAGNTCEVGDLIICVTDGTAANNAHWVVAQNNVDAPVYKDGNTFTSGNPIVADGTGGKAKTVTVSDLINLLTEGSSNAQRNDYIVAQYAGGGTTTTTYHRRKLSSIFAALNSSDITTALGFTPYNSTNPSGYTNTSVKGNAESSYRTGQVNLTPANIGALANTNTGAADRPIYISGNAPAQTTYRMAGTNTTATTAMSIANDLPTGIWFVNGTNSTDLYSQSDGVAIVNQYNSSWISEIYQDYRTGQLAVRGKNNGTWKPWRKILDSTNYTTWVASKDHTHDKSSITSVYEANLEWGGKNFSGSYGPIDAAMIDPLGANRFAFLKAAGLTIEYSNDGGSTWTDYGATDAQKTGLFGAGVSFYLGNHTTAGSSNVNDQLRVTIATSAAGIYTVLNKIAIYMSTNGATVQVKMERALESTPTTYATHLDWTNISGWSGWNILNINNITTYGNTAASQYGRLRFTFRQTAVNSSHASAIITRIMGFGGMGWATPSNMARDGHLYSYDNSQNATFPAKVTATEFIGAINATSPAVITNTKIPLSAGKVTSLAANSSRLYSDGLAISNPATANDVGWIRVTGTGESDTVMEIATGDDAGAGEKIVARQYNTSNAVAKEAQILGINGVTTFPVSVTVQGTTDATSSSVATLISSGGLAVAKKAWIGSGLGASSTNNNSSHLIISSSDTGAGGNVALELWRGTNASWQIGNEGGNLHFRTNWTTTKQTTYSVDAVNIAYNSGNTIIKGTVTAPTFIGALTGTATNANNLLQNTRMDYNWNGINYFNICAANQSAAKVNDTPFSTATWTHILRFNHANAAGYYTDLAVPFNANSLYYKRVANGALQNSSTNGGWVKIFDELQTIPIANGGTGQTTAAGIFNVVRDNGGDGRWVNVAGDTMTGALNFANNTYNKMGDDAQIGDANQSGRIAIKGINGATGIYFAPYSGSTAQSFTINGSGTGTLTGSLSVESALTVGNRLTMTSGKPINQILTGTGTAGTTSGSNYVPAKWTFNTGANATDGDIFTIKIPVAGHDYGVFMSVNNGTNYYPVVVSGTGRVTTHYPVNNYIQVVFESAGSAASMFPLAGGTSRVTVSGGAFRVLNYYDSGNSGLYQNYNPKAFKIGTTAVTAYDLLAEDVNGLIVPAHKVAHRVGSPIYIATSGKAANATGTWWDMYDRHYNMTLRKDGSNLSMTAYNPVYLKGTITGNIFTPDTTTPYVFTTAGCNVTGAYYMYIGDATTSTSCIAYNNSHTYYYYNGSALVHWTQAQSGPNIYYNSGTQTLHIDYVSNSQITTLSQTVSQLTALHATSGGTMKTVAQEIADNGGTITQNTLLNINGTQFRIQNA